MKFRQKMKQRLNTKCSSCGNTVGGGFTGNFSSWLFHQQLCQCSGTTSGVNLVVSPDAHTSIEISAEDQIDLGERFEILGLIGEGGMGSVYKAIDRELNTMVAVKVLRQALVGDMVAQRRFQQEADAVKRLSHPNLVAVLDVGTTQSGVPFIVHEYVDGVDLAGYIRARGHLSVSESTQILHQMTHAVAHAHAHEIIHRDLKPSNVLLSMSADGRHQVKIVDFGIAKATSPDEQSGHLTQTGEVFGSPAYMSPEQCLGESVDARSDIYSLGCITYEMLTGRNPFAAESPVKTILKHLEQKPEAFEIEFSSLKIPKSVEDLVFKCLEKDPKKRFKSASDLEVELHGGPAPWHTRFFAGFVDFGMITFLAMIFVSNFGHFDGLVEYAPIIFCVVVVAFLTIPEGLLGRTIGKRCFNLVTVDSKGRKQGFLRTLVRCLMIMAVPITVFWGNSIVELLFAINGHPLTLHAEWVWYVVGAMFVILNLQVALTKMKQNSVDKMFDRFVVKCPVVQPATAGGASGRQLAIGLLSVVLLVGLPKLEQTLEEEGAKRGVIHLSEVVYATRDIPEDGIIPANALVKRSILGRKVPMDAIIDATYAVGNRARHGISAGQIVKVADIAPVDKDNVEREYSSNSADDSKQPAKKPTAVKGKLLDELKKSKDKVGQSK